MDIIFLCMKKYLCYLWFTCWRLFNHFNLYFRPRPHLETLKVWVRDMTTTDELWFWWRKITRIFNISLDWEFLLYLLTYESYDIWTYQNCIWYYLSQNIDCKKVSFPVYELWNKTKWNSTKKTRTYFSSDYSFRHLSCTKWVKMTSELEIHHALNFG